VKLDWGLRLNRESKRSRDYSQKLTELNNGEQISTKPIRFPETRLRILKSFGECC
jgi:hypothetical protein